jgi:hypothetical protein
METTLLVLAIGMIITAIVGGGVKLYSIEVPTFSCVKRQVVLGLAGVILAVVVVRSGKPQTDARAQDSASIATTALRPHTPDTSADTPSGRNDRCTEFVACGGDVTGRWEVTHVCVTDQPQSLIPECAESTTELSGLRMSGQASYTANGFEKDISASFDAEITVPLACLGGLDCSDFGRQASSSSVTFSCRQRSGACGCRIQARDVSEFERGTYTTAGSVITTRSKDGPSSDEYCVTGDVMRMRDNENGLDGVLVLRKVR